MLFNNHSIFIDIFINFYKSQKTTAMYYVIYILIYNVYIILCGVVHVLCLENGSYTNELNIRINTVIIATTIIHAANWLPKI